MPSGIAALSAVVVLAAAAAVSRLGRGRRADAGPGRDAGQAALFENSLAGVYVIQDGTLLAVNATLARIFGYERPDEIVGRPVSDLVAPECRDLVRENERRRVEGEIAAIHYEFVGLRRNGERVAVEVFGSRTTCHGRPAVHGTLLDVTERVRGEEERRRTERQLEAAERRLRESSRTEAVGRLAGVVAHEYNNLLTAILGHALLLERRLEDDPASRAGLSGIRQAAERAAVLTRQLLAFGQRQMLRPEPVDLDRVIAAMEPMLRGILGASVRLVVEPRGNGALVLADPTQIERVLASLAVRARSVLPDGGRFALATGKVRLDGDALAHGLPPGPYVTLEVSDDGATMDAAARSRVFEPTLADLRPEGSDPFGLAATYGIVRQSGGSIAVDGEPGRGTRFTIHLPELASAPRAVAEAPAAGPPRGREETVLLVEDEDVVRALVRQVLQMNGYAVLEARDGQEALELAARHEGPIHLLLTDLVMPRLGGAALAERLSRERPGIRILYVSGYADDPDLLPSAPDPRPELLQKPFSLHVLAARVREMLDAAPAG